VRMEENKKERNKEKLRLLRDCSFK